MYLELTGTCSSYQHPNRSPKPMASSTKIAHLVVIFRVTLVLIVFAAIMSGSLCHGARVGGVVALNCSYLHLVASSNGRSTSTSADKQWLYYAHANIFRVHDD
ncbi:LOW QUALITY PROTEIN: hypothetical protein SETIT_7G059400v2 [Setaria italica]|uniref:Uncharacterized protein n=1 Tax=Setaria italica TaxID=4555 RepID=A0A368RSN0_SETIT|nr:LOW QUALITY PROTEIN: hypothetical protein SETIT_7G059400v2 [Setaria italica]